MLLDDYYESLEARYEPSLDSNYERLVVPVGASGEPVHRWFHMKEAYSPYLVPRIIKDLALGDEKHLRIHDPFLGSGTTLVSSMLTNGLPETVGTGTEVNPFLALLSRAKLTALSLNHNDRHALRSTFLEVSVAASTAIKRSSRFGPRPGLAAFHDTRFFSEDDLNDILRIKAVWNELAEGGVKDLIGVALAGCVESCSKLRRDGRALRYQPNKITPSVRDEFERRVEVISEDLQVIEPSGSSNSTLSDGLEASCWPKQNSADLVCFSPPYPNNIDYTEVYKLEAWLLGLIGDQLEFRAQRNRTMRSHPSIIFPEREWGDLPESIIENAHRIIQPVLDTVPSDRYRRQRLRVAGGFIEDCAVVLHRSFNALKPGGVAAYVVGNSRHGTGETQYTIASDVLMAEVAGNVGFEIEGIRIARNLHRRGRHDHLRESVVFLKKPEGSGIK